MNKVILVGQFVKDPFEAANPKGDRYVKFCLMTKDFVTKRDKSVVAQESFHYFFVWGVLADFVVRNFKDKRLAIVEGKIAYREERLTDGNTRMAMYVKATKVTPITPADRPPTSQTRREPKPKVRTGDGGDYAYGEVPDRDYTEEVPHD